MANTNTTIVRASKETYTDRELKQLWNLAGKESEHFCYYSGVKIDGIPMLIQATQHVHRRASQRDFKTPAREVIFILVELLEKYQDAAIKLLDIEEGSICIFFEMTGQVFIGNVFVDRIQLSTYLAYREGGVYVSPGDHTLFVYENGEYDFDREFDAHFTRKD